MTRCWIPPMVVVGGCGREEGDAQGDSKRDKL